MALIVQYDVPSSPLRLRSAPGQTLLAKYAQSHVGNRIIVHIGKRNFTFINTGDKYSILVSVLFCGKKLSK